MILKSDTQLVFTQANITLLPALKFTWISQTDKKGKENSSFDVEKYKSPTARTTYNPNVIGGFKLDWNLRGSELNDWKKKQHEKNAFVKEVWKLGSALKGEKSMNMMAIASLVRVSKLNNVKRETIWQILSRHRWSADILKWNSGCLNDSQITEVIKGTGEALNLRFGPNVTWIPEEDLPFVIELYSTLQHCPDHLKEAAQLSVFFESLVTEHNLNTVVASTMHNVQPRVGDNIRDLTSISLRLIEVAKLSCTKGAEQGSCSKNVNVYHGRFHLVSR